MIEKQIINLWIGKQSQQCAFNFYNLQAQQIFDEQQDPLLHSSIWKNVKKLQPRMLIFDTKIERLAAVRQLDTKKILKKMKKQQNYNSLHGMFSHIDTTPLKKHQQNIEQNKQTEWPLITNWTDRQQNYYIIDPGYTNIPTTTKQNPDIQFQRFAVYEQFYKINTEQTQNRLRKQLQNTDFLKLFTICTDQDNSGFTSKMVQYLREQCPKKCYLLTSLSSSNNIPITSISKLYNELDVYLPINLNNLKHPYFQNTTINSQLAPYFSSLYTPFIMKQVDPYFYISTIITDNRKLFNTAYTLPIIGQQLNLCESTNIFKYLQAIQYDENQKQKYKNRNKKKQKQQQEEKMEKYKGQRKQDQKHQQQQQHQQYKINFSNQTYLSLKQLKRKGKFVSQSYILKGHFNHFQKTFKPKSQPSALSIKYLKGIFSAPEQPALTYNKYYNAAYGEKVQAYPYHLVMFNHEYFGEGLRKNIAMLQKNKIFNQEWVESKEMILNIADMYMEVHQESD